MKNLMHFKSSGMDPLGQGGPEEDQAMLLEMI